MNNRLENLFKLCKELNISNYMTEDFKYMNNYTKLDNLVSIFNSHWIKSVSEEVHDIKYLELAVFSYQSNYYFVHLYELNGIIELHFDAFKNKEDYLTVLKGNAIELQDKLEKGDLFKSHSQYTKSRTDLRVVIYYIISIYLDFIYDKLNKYPLLLIRAYNDLGSLYKKILLRYFNKVVDYEIERSWSDGELSYLRIRINSIKEDYKNE